MTTVIYNCTLLDESVRKKGALVIRNKKIIRVLHGNFKVFKDIEQALASSKDLGSEPVFIDAKGLTLTPAFIDMHAHFRYPGQTQKEDLDSGLAAAAAGGFGTLVLMPNTLPVVSSKEAALRIDAEAAGRKKAKVFQTVSITKDFGGESIEHLSALDKKNIPVISEDGHDVLSAAVMLEGMKIAAKKKIIVSCHCEDPELAAKAKIFRTRALTLMAEYKIPAWGAIDKKTLKAVPKNALKEIVQNIKEANSLLELAEDIATERNIRLAQKAGCHIHLCHVSTVKSIEACRRAKAEQKNHTNGFKITSEVTPHHLGIEGTAVPQIFAFVNPPLRTHADREALIDALRNGTADCIATDHAPHTAADKAGGSPGFTGLETAYALCNTVLCGREKFSGQKLSALMSANPARILGLKKGLLREGYDADLVLVDPKELWKVNSAEFKSKGKATPLEGKTLTGRVKAFISGII